MAAFWPCRWMPRRPKAWILKPRAPVRAKRRNTAALAGAKTIEMSRGLFRRRVGGGSGSSLGFLFVSVELGFGGVSVGVDLLLGVLGGRIDGVLLLANGVFCGVFVLVAADERDAREYGE